MYKNVLRVRGAQVFPKALGRPHKVLRGKCEKKSYECIKICILFRKKERTFVFFLQRAARYAGGNLFSLSNV
jgi:hypothetical protein